MWLLCNWVQCQKEQQGIEAVIHTAETTFNQEKGQAGDNFEQKPHNND